MPKSNKENADDILLNLGFDTEDDILGDYIEEIVNQELGVYKTIIQTGVKKGESLFSHVVNGIFVLERLRPILDLSDEEVRVLFCAYSVHDINKLTKFADSRKSFNRIATRDGLLEALADLRMECFFPDYQDYIGDILTLVRVHSGHYHTSAETLHKSYNPYNLGKERVEDELSELIRAADVIDLSKSLDERAKKAEFLTHLNAYCDTQYEFVYHKISEQRGILTNLIHNEIVEYLEGEEGLLPLLFYPDGVAYLKPRSQSILMDESNIVVLGEQIVRKVEEKTKSDFTQFIANTSAGIKVDEKCLSLNVPFADIFNEVRNIISEKVYVKRIDNLTEKCRGRLEARRDKPKKGDMEIAEKINHIIETEFYVLPADDDALRLGELLRTYYIFLKKHFAKRIREPWNHIYQLLRIEDPNVIELYDAFELLFDRGYIVGKELYQSGEFSFDEVFEQIIADGSVLLEHSSSLESEFSDLADYVGKHVDFSFRRRESFRSDFAASLTQYVQSNHTQCSFCGSEFDTEKWMAADVPKNIKVQYFSNRLEGGSSREPKRHICSVCRTQFILDKLCYNVTKDTKTYYAHLYPYSFFTDVFIKAFSDAQRKLRNMEVEAVYLKTNEIFGKQLETGIFEMICSGTKVNGNPLPKFSEAQGNILTIPINAPGRNDTERFLFALENALIYKQFLGCRVTLTDSSIPIFAGDEFSDMFIDSIPPSFGGLLPQNDLSSDDAAKLLEQLLSLHQLYQQVKDVKSKENELVTFIRSLNGGELELYYASHKLINRRSTSGRDMLKFNLMRDSAEFIETIISKAKYKGGEKSLGYIKELAQIAWEGKLKGDSLKDTSLAKPLDVAFDNLALWDEEKETEEEIRAITAKEIEKAIERIAPKYFGETKKEKIAEFVDVLFDKIYKDVYKGNLNEVLERKRRIRAAYLFFVASLIPKAKSKEEE